MAFTHTLALLVFITSLNSFANSDCKPNILLEYVNDNKEFNDAKKLPARINKELRPLNKDINEAYRLGANMRRIEAELSRLRLLKPQSTKVKNQIHDFTMLHAALTREMIDLNNSFVLKMRELFKKQGIPAEIVTTSDTTQAWRMFEGANPEVAGKEVMSLKLTLDSGPTSNEGFNYYRRIQKAFGLDAVTLSLKDTGGMGAGGIFFPHLGRLEVGPHGAANLLRKYIDVTGKHESRHAMFQGKRLRGEASIFHTQFHASPNGNLLNERNFYEQFMSAEELYTFSTDIQTLAQVFKGDFITVEAKKLALLKQMEEKSAGLLQVATTANEVSGKMIQNLEKILALKEPSPNVAIQPGKDGTFNLLFTDELGRASNLTFVSEAEKGLLTSLQEAGKKMEDASDAHIVKRLQEQGVDVEALKKRNDLGTFTEEDKKMVLSLSVEYMKLPETKVLAQEQFAAYQKIIESGKTRMEKLHQLSAIQMEEVVKLRRMVFDGTDPGQIEELKKQMFLIGKNVKEDYKGFGLNPRN